MIFLLTCLTIHDVLHTGSVTTDSKNNRVYMCFFDRAFISRALMRILFHWNPRGVRPKSIPLELPIEALITLLRELDDIADDYIAEVKNATDISALRQKLTEIAGNHAECWMRARVLFGRMKIPAELSYWYEGQWRDPIFQPDLWEITKRSCLTRQPRYTPTGPPKSTTISRYTTKGRGKGLKFREMIQSTMNKDSEKPPGLEEVEYVLESDDSMPIEPPWTKVPRRRKMRRETKPSPKPVRNTDHVALSRTT